MTKQLLFYFFLIGHSLCGLGINLTETQYEDSLIDNVIHEDNITVKLDAYMELIEFYRLNSFTKAIDYSVRAQNTALENGLNRFVLLFKLEEIRTLLYSGETNTANIRLNEISDKIIESGDNKLLSEYYLILNYITYDQKDLSKAHEYGLKSLKYSKLAADSNCIARAYNNLAIGYDAIGNQQKALDYYLLSIDFAQNEKFKDALKNVYNNLGVLYDELGDVDQALYYYEKTLDLAYETFDKYTITTALNNIALIYFNKKNYKETLNKFHKGLHISRVYKYSIDEALICSNLGELYRELKKYDSAKHYLNQAMQLYDRMDYEYSKQEIQFGLAYLNEEMGNYNKAISMYKDIIEALLPKKIDLLVEQVNEQLSFVYETLGDYKMAHFYLSEAKMISDSIGRLSVDEKLAYAEMQIDFKNKLSDYDKEMAETEIQHYNKLLKEKRIRLVVFALAFILLTLTLLIYWRFRKSHIINALLLKRNAEVEEQKALVEITNIELKEQYAFTETLLNTIPNPVFYTNNRGIIIGCNSAFEDVVGVSEADLIGVDVRELKGMSSFYCSLCDEFISGVGEFIHKNGRLVTSKGEEHDIIFNKKFIVDDDNIVIGILGVIIDITEVRDVERSLQLSQQKLKEALNAKDKFFSIMTHDLKNPFNAILGLTHLISDNYESYKAEEVKNYAKLINQSANQIYNLLENLLEWSRAQSGTLIKNPVVFDINEVVKECIDLLENNIEQKDIVLEFDNLKEFHVFVDKNMILTVVRNLLINAIKYTPEKGTISIITTRVNGEVILSISDTGIGIKEENIEKLFKIDEPISTPGLMNEKGTGLGLIIAHEFVNLNGGDINVSSRLNQGSVFTITLPAHTF